MQEVIKKIITNLLIALYQPFGFSIIITILFLAVYMFVKEYGLKVVVKKWTSLLKIDTHFRKVGVLCFYVSMILFRTLLNRNIWANPVSNVIGIWGLYNDKGELTTEAVENFVLFIPFVVLLFWSFHEKILGKCARILAIIWQSIKIVFLFSMTIEFLQLILRLGTFQLSDLFYNTLGGLVGGLIYWVGYKFAHKNKE